MTPTDPHPAPARLEPGWLQAGARRESGGSQAGARREPGGSQAGARRDGWCAPLSGCLGLAVALGAAVGLPVSQFSHHKLTALWITHSNSPILTPPTKACHSPREKMRMLPSGFFESFTPTW